MTQLNLSYPSGAIVEYGKPLAPADVAQPPQASKPCDARAAESRRARHARALPRTHMHTTPDVSQWL